MGDYLSLKWGTLKAWSVHSDEQRALLRRYCDIGASASAISQKDTPEQKEIVCQLIDLCDAPTIALDWDGRDVTKDEAKRYVLEYGRS